MLVALAAVTLGAAGSVSAQPISRSFDRNAPAIGAEIPDAVVYDRDGAELRVQDLLRDRYTVLILGCLT